MAEVPARWPRMPRDGGRGWVVGGGLLLLLLGVSVLFMLYGTPTLSLPALWDVVINDVGDQLASSVIHGIRLPRLLLGVMVGAALGVTGVLMQDTLRNGLAGPELLGVSAGAAAVIATLIRFQAPVPLQAWPWLGMMGALAGGGIVLWAMGRQRDPVRLILIGVAVSTLLNAYTITMIALVSREALSLILLFLRGTLAGRGWEYVSIFVPWFIIGLPLALLCARPLNLLQLGDEVAEGLGMRAGLFRGLMLLLSAALVAAAVTVCGPIGYIALLAPHLTRRALGTSDARRTLPIAALMGATLLMSADLAARYVFEPAEMPVGLWTTIFGVPILLLLLRRQRARTSVSNSLGAHGRPAQYAPTVLLVLAFVAAGFVLHVGMGRVSLTPDQVIAVLFDRPVEPFHAQIVNDVRLPRALVALGAGAMLGLSGAILQAFTRNPLAEPGLTGVSLGAVLMVVFILMLTLVNSIARPLFGLPGVALAGGLATGALVYGLSWKDGVDPMRLALTGVLVAAVLESLVSVILLFYGSQLGGAMLWLIGSLNARNWDHVTMMLPWLMIAIPLGLLSAGLANALQLGDDVARGLGVRLETARAGLLFVACMLAAVSVSVVGAIGFIGLMGPHIARRLVGDDSRHVFLLSMLVAALLLIAADVLTQSQLFAPLLGPNVIVPTGAVVALLGAPFFLYLAWRR